MNNEATNLYNPWLLKHIYTRLIYTTELVHLCKFYRPRKEDKLNLIRTNLYAKRTVYDVNLLNTAMRKERFAMDLSDVNFEWLLYRAAMNLFHRETSKYPSYFIRLSSLSSCEAKIEQILGYLTEDERMSLFDLFLDYIEQYYIKEIVQYKSFLTMRQSMMWNKKFIMERHAGEKQRDSDYIIVYSKELVMTMMYDFLIQELVGRIEVAIKMLNHGEKTTAAAEGKDASIIHRTASILEGLSKVVEKQFKDEFDGFAIASHPSSPNYKEYEQWAMKQNARNNLCYNPIPVISNVIIKTHSIIITEEETKTYRYISLKKAHRKAYCAVAYRFHFDYNLRRKHCLDCVEKTEKKSYALKYAKYCSICHYFEQSQQFNVFYNQCESIIEKFDIQEEELIFFNTVIIPVLHPLLGHTYLTLYNLSLLFNLSTFRLPASKYCQIIDCCNLPKEKKFIDFLQMISIQKLLIRVMREIDPVMIENAMDVNILSCKYNRNIQTEPSVLHLVALQQVLLERITKAISEQEVEIEKFERSLSSPLLEIDAGSSTTLHHDVQMVLIDAYNIYRALICDILCVKRFIKSG
jgi:hypothetical protein